MFQSGRKAVPPKSTLCYRCGQKSHKATSCPYKEAKCHKCGKVGHLQKVCRQGTKQPARPSSSATGSQGKKKGMNLMQEVVPEVESVATTYSGVGEYGMFPVQATTQGSCKPFVVDMVLDGKAHKMEIDTGASVSVVSKKTYELLFKKRELRKSSIRLSTYGGEPLSVLGEIVVDVCHGKKSANLPLLVIDKSGPSLLGRNWLSCFELDWKAIYTMNDSALGRLLDRYQAVFAPGLGTLRGFNATIHIDPDATPRFCQARSVPFSMRALVERELDRLVDEGIVEPVTFSEWAAPIVPVLKADKASVRICGDFKLTVNRVARLDRYPIPKISDLFARLAGGKYFTKLDLSQAYQQVCLDEPSKALVVINTQKGLFRYNRLPYGVSSAPAIFQRTMEALLQECQKL